MRIPTRRASWASAGEAKGPKVTTDPIEYVARPLKTVDDVTN